MKNPKKALLFLFILVCALITAGRFYGRWETLQYGSIMLRVLSVTGDEDVASPEKVQKHLSLPELESHARHVRALSFLTFDYQQRIAELHEGMIYILEQASLPEEQRFLVPPPKSRYLKIELPADHSEQGIASTAGHLIKDYMLGI